MNLPAITKSLGLAALGLAAAIALSACASGAGQSGSSGEADPATAADLVGAWVTGQQYDAPDVPFLQFADDGTWTGSDGCNGAQGDWSIAADGTLTATAGMQTLIACDGAALPTMLTEATLALIDGDSLVLTDSEGAAVVSLVAAPEGTVPGSAVPDAAADVVGTWTAEAPDGVEVFLTFAADQKVSGKDGCNSLMGSWTTGSDGTVDVSSLASTMMYCEGVDTWLSKAATVSIDGDTATVSDATGAEIGTLTRTS
jgi:heat shock protein HslJ